MALMALMAAVAAMTSANWRYIWPLRPGRNAAGTNTAISTSVMPMIGPEQLVHGLDRRVVRGQPVLDVFGGALDHHDRVVDDDADRQNDREQGRQVDREAERRHGGEGADDGHGHGGRRHQGGAPILQEDQDHHQHEQGGLDQRLVDLVDGGADELGGVEGDAPGHARRETPTAAACMRRLDALGDVERVGLRAAGRWRARPLASR